MPRVHSPLATDVRNDQPPKLQPDEKEIPPQKKPGRYHVEVLGKALDVLTCCGVAYGVAAHRHRRKSPP